MRYVILDRVCPARLLHTRAKNLSIKDLPLSRFRLDIAVRLLRDSFMNWRLMPECWRCQPGVLECSIEELIEPERRTSGNLLVDMMIFMREEDIGFFNGQEEYIRLFGNRFIEADRELFLGLLLSDLASLDDSIVDFRSAVRFYLKNPVFRSGQQDNESMSYVRGNNTTVVCKEVARHIRYLFDYHAFESIVSLLTTSDHWMMIHRDFPGFDISRYPGGRRYLVERDFHV